MQIGIFAKTFDRPGSSSLAAAIVDAGFNCTQFNMASLGLDTLPRELDHGLLAAAKRDFDARGVSIPVISGTYNMIDPNPDAVRRGREGFRTLASAAKVLGYSMITLCTGTRNAKDKWTFHPDNAGPQAWRDFLAELERLIVIAEEFDIVLGVEPEPSNVISSAEAAKRLVDEIASNRVEFVFDPFNLVSWTNRDNATDVLLRAFDLIGDVSSVVHAQDQMPDGKPAAPGRGYIDFAWLLQLFMRSGFSGPVIAHGFGEAEAVAVAAHLHAIVDAEGGAGSK